MKLVKYILSIAVMLFLIGIAANSVFAAKPSAEPVWATTGTTTEPAAGKKATGWLLYEKPAYDYLNYWMNLVYEWIHHYENERLINIEDNGTFSDDSVGADQIISSCLEGGLTGGSGTNISIDDAGIVREKMQEGYGNLITNPTATMGNAFWYDGGASTNYDGPADDDPGYANPCSFDTGILAPAVYMGPSWTADGTSQWGACLSEPIEADSTDDLSFSGFFMASISSGTYGADVIAYSSAGKYLSTICELSHTTAHTEEISTATTCTAPASTDYVRVRIWKSAVGILYIWRALSLEKRLVGSQHPAYSDDSSPGHYLSARYNSDAGQSVSTGTSTTIILEDKSFDDPGIDRYNPDIGWFRADRYMKLRVSATITFASSAAWDHDEYGEIKLEKRLSGGSGGTWALLDRDQIQYDTGSGGSEHTAYTMVLSGSTLIELNKGDQFFIQAYHTAGASLSLSSWADRNYIDIEEIN